MAPRKAMKLLAVTAASAALLAACSEGAATDGTGEGSSASGEESLDLALLTGDISDFGQAQVTGLERAAEEYGGSLTIFDSGDDAQTQDAACQDIITSGRYNAVVMNSANAAAAAACAQDALDAGLEVVAMETPIGTDANAVDPQLDGQAGSVVWVAEELGQNQFAQVVDVCEGIDPCKFIMIIGFRGYHLDDNRMAAIEAELEKHPHIEMVAIGEDGYDGAVGQQVANDLLRANPDVHAIVTSSDSTAVQVPAVMEQLGLEGIQIFGDGASNQGVDALKNGEIHGTIAAWPEEMGYQAGLMAGKAVRGETIDDPGISMYELGDLLGEQPVMVTQDNAGEVTPEWG